MIDQNTIISMLNEVIPQMQKSEKPEETLLKYATDKNLPPAVLERMTHMFNALKTNCYMDHADTMEKRGSQFSLIDAPSLLEKYTTFTEDTNNTTKNSISDITSFWDIQSPKMSMAFKIANTSLKEAKLSELFENESGDKEYKSYIDSLFNEELDKVASENINALSQTKKESLFDKYYNHKQTLENLNEYITTEQHKQASIVKDIRNMLRDDETLLEKFAKFESDAILLDEDVKKAMPSLIASLGYDGNNFYKENIKRANDHIEKYLIKDIHPITQKIIDYSNCEKCIKTAADPFIYTGAGEEQTEPSPEAKAKAEAAVGEALDMLGMGDDDDEEVVVLPNWDEEAQKEQEEKDQIRINNAVESALKKGIKNPFDKDLDSQPSEDTSNKDTESTSKSKSKSTKKDNIESNAPSGPGGPSKGTDFAKILGSGFNDLNSSLNNALKDVGSINKSIWDIANKASQKVHSKKIDSIKAFYDKTSDLLFQKMMLTDPILSKISDPSIIEDIKDAYKTYKMQYPEIAFQPALLKSVLRGAAQVGGGEDISTFKDLVSARKGLADARKIENDLINLNIL